MGQPTRRLLSRVVLWQPSTGAIIDLPSRAIGTTGAPTRSESRATMSDGSASTVSRGTTAEIPLGDREARVMSRVFRMNNCPVKAALLGLEGTEHALWLEPTRINVQWPELETGRSRITVDMESSIFSPAIWRGMDLIEGVPWQHTESRQLEGPIQLRYPGNAFRPGYEGPAFESNLGVSVDMRGSTDGLTEAEMRFEFPVWGSTLKLSAIKGYTLQSALLNILDWKRSVMKSVPPETEVTVPVGAFFVEVKIGSAGGRPRLDLVSPGQSKGVVYTGTVRPDCTRGPEPPWDELPFPNKAPQWEQRENLSFGLDNEPPTLACNDFTVVGENTGGDNSPQQFTCEDYTVLSKLTGGGSVGGGETLQYTAPTASATKKVYTSKGGLASFKYPDANQQNIFDDRAISEVTGDFADGFLFVPVPGGIDRYDLSGGSQTSIQSNTGRTVAGMCADPFTDALYVSYEATPGIWWMNYDGTARSEVISDAGQNYSLVCAPDGGDGGYIFGLSNQGDEDEIARWPLAGGPKTVVLDLSAQSFLTVRNLHVSRSQQLLFFQTYNQLTERAIVRVSFTGSNFENLFSTFSTSNIFDETNWTVLEAEEKWIEVQQREGAGAKTFERNLDGSSLLERFLNNLTDTGAYVTSIAELTGGNATSGP